MANNSVLKAAIADVVKQNGTNAITGDLLQQSLLSMIDALGGNYQYAGIATPTTNPGTPDQNVFYLAATAGTYTNFGGIVLADDDVAVIKGSGATWTKEVTGVANAVVVNRHKSYNYTKNDYTNSLVKEIHIDGTEDTDLKYFVRSCMRYRNSDNKFYFAICSYDTGTQERLVVCEFSGISTSGIYSQTRSGKTIKILVALSNQIDNTDCVDSVDYAEEYEINKICWDNVPNIISTYDELDSAKLDITHLLGIWNPDEYVRQNLPYTLVSGNYDSNAEIQPSTYKSVKYLIPCKKGDIFLFDNVWDDYSIATMAFWVYDSNKTAIGSRINKNNLTPNENGEVIYKITQEGAAYIGLSTNYANPRGIYLLFQKLSFEFIESIKKDTEIGKVVDLMIFMGQSNMAGRGIPNPLNPETSPSVPLKYGREFRAISDPTKLYPIADPFGYNENNPDGINDGTQKKGSLVPAFVNAYYQITNTPIIGVSASEGATNIIQWQPDGDLLPDAIVRFNDCVEYLEKNFYTIRHKYMVWCQGENDYENRENYETLFRNVIDAMKNAGVEKCLLIRIGRNNNPGNTAQDYIINIQTQMAKDYQDIILISTAFSKFRGSMQDDQHFYQNQYNEVGNQSGHNAGCWADFQIERMQYDSMTGQMYFSDKCY